MAIASTLKIVAEERGGVLYKAGDFLVPVLAGSPREMGAQYGSLMADAMQQAYDSVVKPQVSSGAIDDEVMKRWTDRAVTTFSTRNREFYAGVVEGSGWRIEKVGMLDQVNEFGEFQSKLHSFAGCTSIFSWGSSSSDGSMYIGRNMDWSALFNEFPQTLTVLNPTDGSYAYANFGWPGMFNVFTSLNEHGVYMDLHDGTSMGGSTVFLDRRPFLNTLSDVMAESASRDAVLRRLNSSRATFGLIIGVADESTAASMECAGWDNRVRLPGGDSVVTVNTFLDANWGIGRRDTVSHSLERLSNMTARLAENAGSIDAATTRDLMDLTLFDPDGTFTENGGATKPTKVDADQTTHQMVTDVGRRQVWLKVPNPRCFADWTHIDLATLFD
jgi:hypothetical protein